MTTFPQRAQRRWLTRLEIRAASVRTIPSTEGPSAGRAGILTRKRRSGAQVRTPKGPRPRRGVYNRSALSRRRRATTCARPRSGGSRPTRAASATGSASAPTAERQWGTVREDYSAGGHELELLPARSRAQPCLPLGRGRPARGLRTARDGSCFAVAPRNGADPDPQRAPVRAHGARGQPRRGRQGGVLLPRRDADPLVRQGPLQVSAARVPLRRPRRGERAARAARPRVRARRHGRLRRRPLLRRHRRARQGLPRRRARHHHGRQPRARGGAPGRAADALVPQHLGLGPHGRGLLEGGAARPWSCATGPAASPRSSPSTRRWAATGSSSSAGRAASRPSCSSRRTRPTPCASSRGRTRRRS